MTRVIVGGAISVGDMVSQKPSPPVATNTAPIIVRDLSNTFDQSIQRFMMLNIFRMIFLDK